MAAPLLLVFTGATDVRADEARSGRGTVIRSGSVVGFAELGGVEVTVVGLRMVLAQWLGPLAIEATYDLLSMSEAGPLDNDQQGTLQRWGAGARLALGSKRIGRTTFLRLWLEGGLGRQRARWHAGVRGDRTDVMAGAGWTLDFDVERPFRPGFPTSWGWNFGWRLMGSDGASGTPIALAACRRAADDCSPPPAPAYDLSVMLASELVMTW